MSLSKVLGFYNAANTEATIEKVETVEQAQTIVTFAQGVVDAQAALADDAEGKMPKGELNVYLGGLRVAENTVTRLTEKAKKQAEAEATKSAKAPSTASLVREHIAANFSCIEEAKHNMKSLVSTAMELGIATSSAARQCVAANIPKVLDSNEDWVAPVSEEAPAETPVEESAE